MKKKKTKKDPHAKREAQKYDNPVASREFILELLAEHDHPVPFKQLLSLLNIKDDDRKFALRNRVRAMVRDGQLIMNRKGAFSIVTESSLFTGTVVGHRDGFGFVVLDDPEQHDDIFLSERHMRSVMDGDKVKVRVIGLDRRGRREGMVIKVLQRNHDTLVGRFIIESGTMLVVPDNKRITHDIIIPDGHEGKAVPGQIVVVAIEQHPTMRTRATGRIAEILGEHMAPGMEVEVAIRKHQLPSEWPIAAQQEADKLGTKVALKDKKDRVDVRGLPFVTIDGADAKDFDDAVYCEKRPRAGWKLYVAIADVSHYVEPGSALDTEAQQRGNSVYFPDNVIPMLPEALSNGLCSLKPKVDRLCMVCEINLDNNAVVKSFKFYSAVMHSKARMTYDDVASLLTGDDAKLNRRYKKLLPHFENLHELYQLLLKQRNKRGAIDFDSTETQIIFGDNRKIEKIVPTSRNVAHRIIEECMLLANVCTAEYLLKHKIPTLYRVHQSPPTDKVTNLIEFLSQLGLGFGKKKADPTPKDYSKVLKQASKRDDAHLIQTVMLRSLAQSVYSPDNEGHFGLAFPAYAHFTSPIRRYPDLLVHRAIKHLLRRRKAKTFLYSHADMQQFGEQCSMTERRADEATWDVTGWLKCEFMLDKLGEEFDGIVSSVTSFGVFVELSDIYIDGLVHIKSLHDDYYQFDKVHHRLIGERTGKNIKIGDKMRVRVMRVDLDERQVDFDLVDGEIIKSKPKSKPKKKSKVNNKRAGKKRSK